MDERTAPADVGSRPSFEDYVSARGTALLRTAWLLTGDRQRAEDLVQTALGKTWPKWSHISQAGEGAYDAYVRKVMVTTFIAWWRRRWQSEYPTADVPETAGVGTETIAVDRHDVMAALAELPRGQRAVVVMRYFEDLTEAQTADALGCSVGTVKSQNARALSALRRSRSLAREEARDV